MATRTGYAGVPVATNALTASNFNKLPGGQVGRTTTTADSGGTTSTETIFTLSSVPCGSSRQINVHVRGVLRADIASGVQVKVTMDGTQIGRINGWTPGLNTASVTTGPTLANNAAGKDWYFDCIFTCQPSSGSHDFALITGVSGTWSGTPTVTLIAGTATSSQGDCLMEVTDVGPSY